MQKIASFTRIGWWQSIVYQNGREYLVQFWNSEGRHMTACDYRIEDRADAMLVAGEGYPGFERLY